MALSGIGGAGGGRSRARRTGKRRPAPGSAVLSHPSCYPDSDLVPSLLFQHPSFSQSPWLGYPLRLLKTGTLPHSFSSYAPEFSPQIGGVVNQISPEVSSWFPVENHTWPPCRHITNVLPHQLWEWVSFLSSFYRWANWGLENLNYLTKVTQPTSDGDSDERPFESKACFFFSLIPQWPFILKGENTGSWKKHFRKFHTCTCVCMRCVCAYIFRDRKEKQGDEAGKIRMTLRRIFNVRWEGLNLILREMPAEEKWLKPWKETRDLCFRRGLLLSFSRLDWRWWGEAVSLQGGSPSRSLGAAC